ncbi:MAG: response regulator transcription factor [Chitinophagaceae bacterium]
MYPDALIAEAETFDEVIRQVDAQGFDLVLLDIQIPGGDNLQMVEAIKLRTSDTRVLIVSGYNEELYALHYIEAGAHGYLQKNANSDTVKQAIQKVMADEKYISAFIREQLIQQKPVNNTHQ